MAIQLFPLTTQELETTAIRQEIVAIYSLAFTAPSYAQREENAQKFAQMLGWHILRPGFRCYAAGEEGEECILGFAYGYTSRSGQWWYDTVTKALSQHARAIWFDDPFELAELAVLPEGQGRGIGGRLHDAVLEGLPFQNAVLSTYQGETRAMHLYRKRGWVPLLEDFYFPGNRGPMVIMGLDLYDRI